MAKESVTRVKQQRPPPKSCPSFTIQLEVAAAARQPRFTAAFRKTRIAQRVFKPHLVWKSSKTGRGGRIYNSIYGDQVNLGEPN